ncbi:hypothetical protein GIB67_020565 [Kingdonia uniflora]|uniref:Uncharacterized protein n=1 Tax=Kingdonia uniflora TaxID=39325 RepID=A0A7J7NLC5_9MAGN|nr:hypothetical protein GIB67_020565 [Kingdonia uniflora]
MARIFGGNELQADTLRVVGTYGYMSPEYTMDGRYVFSFGILLLEIVSGKRNTSFSRHEQHLSLLGYAWKLWNEDNLSALIDPGLSEPCFEEEILRCIHVGLLCVQDFAEDGPTMSIILSMLSEIAPLPLPKQPAFTERQASSSSDYESRGKSSVNPDEAVAFGAAVQGGILSGEGGDETKDILLLDVAPLTLGIETVGGVMTKIIQRNSERILTKDCRELGKFDLTGISPAPRGTPQIAVTFEVDANGILNVRAEDNASRKSEKITITNKRGRLSQEEIDRMVQEAEEFAEEDKKIKEKIDARNSLETYVYNMKNQINDKGKLADKIESEDKEKIETATKEALEWLDENQRAEKEDYEEKLKEVEAVCNPIITAVYQKSGTKPSSKSEAKDEDHDEL